MKTLECNVNGDKRYASQYCFIDSFGIRNSIENHYQTTKRYTFKGEILVPKDWRDVIKFKELGAEFSHFELPNGLTLGSNRDEDSLVAEYFCLLWYKFLLKNTHLVDEAMKYDRFISGLEDEHPYTQAQVVRDTISHSLDYIKSRGESLAYAISVFAKEKGKK